MFKFFTERTMQLRKIWYYLNLLTDPKYSKEVRQYRLDDFLKVKEKNCLMILWKIIIGLFLRK